MNLKTKNLVFASFFLALGLIIPYVFHIVGIPGTVFLPMHLPVLLCGFILGPRYGLMIGFVVPFFSSILTGMPPLYPVAIAMSFELATYGVASGYLYKNKKINIIPSLISAMLLGRAVNGVANYLLLTFGGKVYIFKMFLASAFIKPIWGIIIQLVLIPILVNIIQRNVKSTGI